MRFERASFEFLISGVVVTMPLLLLLSRMAEGSLIDLFKKILCRQYIALMVFIEDDRTYGWLSSVAIEEHGQTGDRVADLVFTQTERVETIDGSRGKVAMQAKRCLDIPWMSSAGLFSWGYKNVAVVEYHVFSRPRAGLALRKDTE